MNELMTTTGGVSLKAIQEQAAILEVSTGIANAIAKAGMLPASYKGNVQAGAVAIMFGAGLGFNPLQSIQSIAVVNGMPSIWGDGVLALIQASGLLEDISFAYEGEGDNFASVVTMKRKGMQPHSERFSVAMAKRAGLWGKQGPWSQYSATMLRRRALNNGARLLFADVLRGISIDSDDIAPIEGGKIESSPIPPRPSSARNSVPVFDVQADPVIQDGAMTEEVSVSEEEVSGLACHLIDQLQAAASGEHLAVILASHAWAEMAGYAGDFPKMMEGVNEILAITKQRLGVA